MAKYYKQDSEKGYIEDSAQIEAQKFNNVRHSVLGYMLGDFDDNGFYRVNPEIVSELISMPKYIFETMDNIEICQSTLKFDKQISFMVVFEGNKATLSLIEKVSYESNHALNSGTWSNVNEYVLDEYETSGEINRQMLYLKWNISTYPGAVIDIFSCDPELLEKYFNIVNRFKYNLKANALLLEKHKELEEIEAEYFLDIFEILKDYPELKVAVEKQIQVTLEEKKEFLKIDKPNFAKTLNEVLEKAIEDNIDVLKENEKETFEEQKHNVTVKANIKKYEVLEIEKTKEEENTILTVKTEEFRFQPLQELATEVATVQKKVEEEVVEKAVDVVVEVVSNQEAKAEPREETNKEKLTQVVQQIIKKEPEKVENLVSQATKQKIEKKKEEIAAKKQTAEQANNQQQAQATATAPIATGNTSKGSSAKKGGSTKKGGGNQTKKKTANKEKPSGGGSKPKPSLDKIKKDVKTIEELEKTIKQATLDLEVSVTYRNAQEIFNKIDKAYKKLNELYEGVKKAGKGIGDAAKLLKTAEASKKSADSYYKRAEYALNDLKRKAKTSGTGMIAARTGGVTTPRNPSRPPVAPRPRVSFGLNSSQAQRKQERGARTAAANTSRVGMNPTAGGVDARVSRSTTVIVSSTLTP